MIEDRSIDRKGLTTLTSKVQDNKIERRATPDLIYWSTHTEYLEVVFFWDRLSPLLAPSAGRRWVKRLPST